jgi:hypothetical protein
MYCPRCDAGSPSANAHCKCCDEWLPDIKARARSTFRGESPQQNIIWLIRQTVPIDPRVTTD